MKSLTLKSEYVPGGSPNRGYGGRQPKYPKPLPPKREETDVDEKRANELIKLGEEREERMGMQSEAWHKEFDLFSERACYKEIPGLGGYYEVGNLQHGDVRKLFLMFMGAK